MDYLTVIPADNELSALQKKSTTRLPTITDFDTAIANVTMNPQNVESFSLDTYTDPSIGNWMDMNISFYSKKFARVRISSDEQMITAFQVQIMVLKGKMREIEGKFAKQKMLEYIKDN